MDLLIDLLSKDLDYEIHNPAIKALTNIIKGNVTRQEKAASLGAIAAVYGCIVQLPALI